MSKNFKIKIYINYGLVGSSFVLLFNKHGYSAFVRLLLQQRGIYHQSGFRERIQKIIVGVFKFALIMGIYLLKVVKILK